MWTDIFRKFMESLAGRRSNQAAQVLPWQQYGIGGLVLTPPTYTYTYAQAARPQAESLERVLANLQRSMQQLNPANKVDRVRLQQLVSAAESLQRQLGSLPTELALARRGTIQTANPFAAAFMAALLPKDAYITSIVPNVWGVVPGAGLPAPVRGIGAQLVTPEAALAVVNQLKSMFGR